MSRSLARLTAVTLLLLAPAVFAGSPPPSGSTYSLSGQEVTDLSMDPSGEFVVGVVQMDATGLVPVLTKEDIYPCHFGPPSSTNAGSGCRVPGWQHGPTFRAAGGRQVVDYTSYSSTSGLIARFVVGGPADTLSLWSNIEDVPRWEIAVPGSQNVINVSIATDASRILVGTAPSNAGGTGRFLLYNSTSTTPSLSWEWTLSDSRPSAMGFSRVNGLAAVGTTSITSAATGSGEVFVFKPRDAKPTTGTDIFRFSTGGAVTQLAFSSNGQALVVATTQGVYYVPIDTTTGRPAEVRSFTSLSGGAQRVALSLDGERFAAASGTKIHFFRHLNNSLISERVGSEHETNATVADLAYDATGQLLVAISGNNVLGYGPTRTTPIWTFDATATANGALDGPLRKVVLSDLGERIVVAGRTTLAPYRTTLSAAGTFLQAQGLTVQPATTTRLSLTVRNTGSLSDNYSFSAHFQGGLSGLSPDPVRLDPEQTATVNLTVDVPPGQSPGFYGVQVDIRSESALRLGRQVILASPSLNLTVPRSVVLNVTSEDRVPALRQGGEVVVPVTIRNRGNAEGVVNLTTTQRLSRGTPWDVRFAQEQVNIPAGAEVTLNLAITAPVDAASGDRNDITVCAREGQPKACQKDGGVNEAFRVVTAYVDPRFGAELNTNATSFEFGPGELKVVTVSILNTGNTDDAYNLTATIAPSGISNDWRITLERDYLQLARGEKRSVAVTVRAAVTEPRDASLIVKAISIGSSHTQDGQLTVSLVPRPIVTTTTPKSFLPGPSLILVLSALALIAATLRRGGR